MTQRRPDVPGPHELAPLPTDGRMVKAEAATGDYYGYSYYGYAQSRSAQAKNALQLLRRQRWMLLGVFLAVLTVGCLWVFTRTPRYRAVAEILVTPMERGGGGSDSLAQDISVMMRVRSVATQVKLMKSADLLDAAFASLPEATRKKGFRTIEGQLDGYPVNIANPKDTEIIGVEVTAFDPKAAADFANQITLTSMAQRQDNIRAMAEMATEHVSNELRYTEKNLQQARTELAALKRQTGIVDLGTQTTSDAQGLANLESQATQASADLQAARERRVMLQSQLRRTPRTIVSSRTSAENPLLRTIDEQIERLEQQRAQLLQEYLPSAPEIRDVDSQIAQARARKARLISSRTATETVAVNPLHDSLQQQYISAVVAEQEAQSRLGTTRGYASEVKGRLKKLPDVEERLALMISRVNELQNTHVYLTSQLQALRLSMHGGLPNVIPITQARPDPFPVSPNIPVSLLLIAVIGLVIAVATAVVRDGLDERVRSSETIESLTGARVLAALPEVRNGFGGLVNAAECPSGMLESFRLMRNAVFLGGPDAPKVVVVTSPHAGEGKTTTSSNLALTTALGHRRVLLIDGDLRHPSVHKAYRLDNSVGLSNLLHGDKKLAACLQSSGVSGLDILTAGPSPTAAPELLAAPAMRELLEQARENYDTILIDCTPVLHLSDSLQLAAMADGAILVVASTHTENSHLGQAMRALESVGCPVLGIVYNRASDIAATEWRDEETPALPAPKALAGR